MNERKSVEKVKEAQFFNPLADLRSSVNMSNIRCLSDKKSNSYVAQPEIIRPETK